jgi:hypothetical protein
MSKTWQTRISRARRRARTAGLLAVVVCAVIGFAAGVKVFLVPAHPDDEDVAALAVRIANQRDAAGQFAADFVATVLTTPSSKRAGLQRFITMQQSETAPQSAQSAPPPPAVINTPKVWSVVPKGSTGDADLYSVTVVVQQRPYASADAVRAFYRVPVAIWQYQPRAMDWPTPISDPGPGADVKQGYGHSLNPAGPIYAVVSGFITTYLTAAAGLDRYVVADSWIKPIGGYQNAIVKSAEFAMITFSFPLTVENSGGTWMIADIDLIPQISSDTEATPANGTHS